MWDLIEVEVKTDPAIVLSWVNSTWEERKNTHEKHWRNDSTAEIRNSEKGDIPIRFKVESSVCVCVCVQSDLGSIPGQVIPKTLKMVCDTYLLNTQQYKVCIKGKVEQSWERSSVLPYTSVL